MVSAVLAAIFLGISFGYLLYTSRSELIRSNVDLLISELISEEKVIEEAGKDIENTLLAISKTPPLQGMIRAQDGGGFDTQDGSSMEQWQSRLSTIFRAQMEASQSYFQWRYIDANGDELVREDELGGELQNKAGRTYFIESIGLEPGEIYVSQAELNREGSPPTVSQPPTGVVRYATPIYKEGTDQVRGILVANVYFDNLIDDREFIQQEEAETYITNQDGHYLFHPDEAKRWGNEKDLGHDENIFKDFPGLREAVEGQQIGFFTLNSNIFVFTSAQISQQGKAEPWYVFIRLPKSSILAPINQVMVWAGTLGLVTFVVLFFVFLWSVRHQLKPLEELAEGAERVARGDFKKKVKIRSQDEIGKVALSFNQMMSSLKELYSSLEEKVQERTRQLQAERNKIETIVEGIGDGVFVVDADRKIVLFNRMTEHLSGFSKKEALGKKFDKVLNFLSEETGKKNDQFIEKVFKTGKMQSMSNHTVIVQKNGQRVSVADSAAPIKNKDGKVVAVVVVFRDVSQERAVDQAKTEFVSLASHQLRTPLTAIKWNTELLLDPSSKLKKEQLETIQDIASSNERMVELVNSLLNVSRIDLGTFSIEPKDCHLEEVANSILDELKGNIRNKKLKVSTSYDKELPALKADPNLLRIILQNLLSNAVKYTPAKGKVELSISKDTRNVTVKIKDSGIGIPKAQQSKVFSKLFRADNALQEEVDGTGLGLYLVKSILEEVGGSIQFESTEGKGTTFTIKLPRKGMKAKKGSKGLE